MRLWTLIRTWPIPVLMALVVLATAASPVYAQKGGGGNGGSGAG